MTETIKKHLEAASEAIDINDPETAQTEIKAALALDELEEGLTWKALLIGFFTAMPFCMWTTVHVFLDGGESPGRAVFEFMMPLLDAMMFFFGLCIVFVTLYIILRVGYLALFVGRPELK